MSSPRHSMSHNPINPSARDMHYQAQLASLQAGIHLIMGCDASGSDMRLLDDSSEGIQALLSEELDRMGFGDLVTSADVTGGASAGVGGDQGAFRAMGLGGKWYGQFVEAVNEGMEERDAELTLLFNNHQNKVNSLDLQHKRSVVLARCEHELLSNTIKARLMARLKTQVQKLAAEKESTSSTALTSLENLSSSSCADLAETNALLLDPSQFSLAPPLSSPSRPTEVGKGTRRKPRRRVGEVEELLSFGASINFDPPNSSTSKRKRTNRRNRGASKIEGTHTPIHNAASPPSTSVVVSGLDQQNIDREALQHNREELLKRIYLPIYSFDKLFTDKELQMAGHQAAIAALRFLTERPQMRYDDADADDGNGGSEEDGAEPTGLVASTSYPGETFDADDNAVANGGNGSGNSNYHTRSNPPRFMHGLGGLVFNGVPGLGATFVNKAGVAPPPSALQSDDVEADLASMRRDALAARSPRNRDRERDAKKVRRG